MIKVEPAAAELYERGPYPLPSGTLIIKEEFGDAGCTDLLGWTLMHKQPAGYDPRFGDWRWQRLDPRGKVLEDGRLPRCASCHAASALPGPGLRLRRAVTATTPPTTRP